MGEVTLEGPLMEARLRDMLACGHVANALHNNPHDGKPSGHPCCAIHAGLAIACEVIGLPNLTDRMAKCSYKSGRNGQPHTPPVPSDWNMAFFSFKGDGSHDALNICKTCRYAKVAHGAFNTATKRPGITDHEFEPHGAYEFDEFYDGCWGWD